MGKLKLRTLLWLGLGGIGISLLVALIDGLVRLVQVSPILTIVVVGLIVGAGVALGWRFVRSKPKPRVKQYRAKLEAAQENLVALELQLDKIKDQVAQEALRYQSDTLRQHMTKQEPQVVVFGVGAAGKTSLVNALMGREQGQVAPTMGTTELGIRYRPVRIGQFSVSITDCPGILEQGIAGTDREELARKIATRADLLLFVVDDDLRQTEFQLLQELTKLGKTMILVFNKIDRYTKADQAQISNSIRARLQDLAIPLVAVAARPQPIELPTGEIYHPPHKLAPLLAEIDSILDREATELMADNILLQCQSLTTEARAILTQQREQLTQQIIDRYQWIVAGAVVANPIPLADFLATAAVHTQMVIEIAQVYDCQISREDSQSLVQSLTQTLTGLGVTKTALHLITTALTVNPLGLIAKTTIGGITAAYLTRIAGQSFQQYFAQQGQWGDGGITAVVQAQFDLTQRQELIQSFVEHHSRPRAEI